MEGGFEEDGGRGREGEGGKVEGGLTEEEGSEDGVGLASLFTMTWGREVATVPAGSAGWGNGGGSRSDAIGCCWHSSPSLAGDAPFPPRRPYPAPPLP